MLDLTFSCKVCGIQYVAPPQLIDSDSGGTITKVAKGMQ